MNRTSKNSKIIQATREKVYNAFTDRKALEFWLAPDNMTGKIHDFDLKVGGGYNMLLFYIDNETAGKSSGNEDRFSVNLWSSNHTKKLSKQLISNLRKPNFQAK